MQQTEPETVTAAAEETEAVPDDAPAVPIDAAYAVLQYPDYLEKAADTPENVTDGYTFEILAEPGIQTEIPIVETGGIWKADAWGLGSISDLIPEETENGT